MQNLVDLLTDVCARKVDVFGAKLNKAKAHNDMLEILKNKILQKSYSVILSVLFKFDSN